MPFGRVLRGTLGLFLLGHFTHHLVTAIHVPLLPLLRDQFSLDYFRAGLLVSAFSLVYGVAQLPTGWIADRLGRRLLITLGFAGMALAAFAIGLARDFYQVVIFLGLVGLLGGSYHPSAPPLISEAVPQETRGRALGIHLIGGSVGFSLAPLAAGFLASQWTWRGAFMVLAIPTGLTSLLFWRFIRERRVSASPALAGGEQGSAWALLRSLGLLVGVAILAQATTTGVNSFLPIYLVDKHGVSPLRAGMFLSLVYGAGLVAAPLGGALSDRVGRKPVILSSALATGLLVYLLTVLPMGVGLMAVFFLLGTAMYARMPVVESLIVDVVPVRQRSSVFGVYYFLVLESSSAVAPGMGFLIDRVGPDRGFLYLAAVVVGVTLLALPFLLRKKVPPFSEKGGT